MSSIEIVRCESNQLRFLAYNTFCEILLRDEDAQQGLWEGAIEIAEQIRRMLDAYDEMSELSALRKAETGQPVRISDELFKLLHTLLAACAASKGAFHIALGGLSKLWNFASDHPQCPDPQRISKLLQQSRLESVLLDETQKTVTFLQDGIQLDIGAAGKGYAAGRLAAYLRAAGVGSASVNLGGNLCLLGSGPRQGRWAVGVQQPWDRRGLTLGTLYLDAGQSVSTSGGYDRFFIQNGKVWHHLLDPRTGYPVENGPLGCTVVCSDALLGDVLSTTLFVGGEACLRSVAELLCPQSKVGYVRVEADGTVEISPELENVFCPAWES